MARVSKLLEGIKHLVLDVPKEAKLLAHTSLYRPMHEYADLVFGLLTQLLTIKKSSGISQQNANIKVCILSKNDVQRKTCERIY